MDNRLPEELIEEVRQQADIVEIISEHVVLKRTGIKTTSFRQQILKFASKHRIYITLRIQ
jgi:hypothetical protein